MARRQTTIWLGASAAGRRWVARGPAAAVSGGPRMARSEQLNNSLFNSIDPRRRVPEDLAQHVLTQLHVLAVEELVDHLGEAGILGMREVAGGHEAVFEARVHG